MRTRIGAVDVVRDRDWDWVPLRPPWDDITIKKYSISNTDKEYGADSEMVMKSKGAFIAVTAYPSCFPDSRTERSEGQK